MDEIKSKFLDLIHKQQDRNLKIPSMGFTDYYAQSQPGKEDTAAALAAATKLAKEAANTDVRRLPDQEILDGMEEIYFEPSANCEQYELMKFNETTLDYGTVEQAMLVLKQQHKVVATKVLQHILDQRPACDTESANITETEQLLHSTLADCRRARAHLQTARQSLTTNSLELLATYKRRDTLHGLLKTLHIIRRLRDTEQRLQQLLAARNYAGAIAVLLECRSLADEHQQYRCVGVLSAKLQDTLLLTEMQLDGALAECTLHFEAERYGQLQRAYRMLGRARPVVDQLHMNFVSAIHGAAFRTLRDHCDRQVSADDRQKMLYEQLCENVASERYTQCCIALCKAFWAILVCYYQASAWHQNEQLFADGADATDVGGDASAAAAEDRAYIQQKFQHGQARIWSDIQAKCCTLLGSRRLHTLKYEHFIQVLSIVRRLRKVGIEFCGDQSANLMEAVRAQSLMFFQRYHAASLEEICLFVDNESWMPVASFTHIQQLQEFRSMRAALQRHRPAAAGTVGDGEAVDGPMASTQAEVDEQQQQQQQQPASMHSQEDGAGSSIYGSCGYFYSFAEKSSPFDGGFDDTMLEEDILAGIADESSCYYSEESDSDNDKEQPRDETDATAVSASATTANAATTSTTTTAAVVNNSSLNVLRCIGRYLQMCRLLHAISPNIVASMTELIDFYTFVVHDVFGSDLPVPSDNLYTQRLTGNLERIAQEVIPKVKNWPPSFSMIQLELCNPDTMYGLQQRAVAVESACGLVHQFGQLRGYLGHVLPSAYRQPLHDYVAMTSAYVGDLRTPVFMCVTARAVDLPGVLAAIGRLKWDIQHVSGEHSAYVETINRAVQLFAMRLDGELTSSSSSSSEATTAAVPAMSMSVAGVWDSLAHVLTHTLVEGYAMARKCSAAGRALMQLDFTHFMSVLEMMAGRKFATHRGYVDAYIKAYYMPRAELEVWCREQVTARVYSGKQLSALVQCVCANDRKARQRLLQVLEQEQQLESGGSPNSSFG